MVKLRIPSNVCLVWIVALATVTVSTIVTVVDAQVYLPIPSVIVQIGDSYASGHGAGNYDGVDGCFQSTTSWGAQFAQSINNASTFINRGCSGSKFDDVSNDRLVAYETKDGSGNCSIPKSVSDEFYTESVDSSNCGRSVTAQMSSVNYNSDLVIFSMGEDELQIEKLFKACLIVDSRVVKDCQDQINYVRNNAAAWTQKMTKALLKMIPLMKPAAPVIVLQFPHMIQNTPYTFRPFSFRNWLYRYWDGAIEITTNLRSLGTILDDSQRCAIAKANQIANRTVVRYFDRVKPLFEGHEPHPSPYVSNTDGWIYEEQAGKDRIGYYHLNPTGQTQLAKALKQYVTSLPRATSPVVCSVTPAVPIPCPSGGFFGGAFYKFLNDIFGTCL